MLIYDLLLKGGTIVDPGSGLSCRADVGIIKPNIAGVVQQGDNSVQFRESINVNGLLLVPGLIDFHTHIFIGGMEIAVDPGTLLSHGVVATVDAGSVGYPSFSYCRKEVMMRTPLITNAVLNVSRMGLLMLHESEFAEPGFINAEDLGRTISVHQDVILGIKMRFSRQQVGDNGLAILKQVKKIANDLQVKLFIHSTDPPAPFPILLEQLEKGDVLIHMYHGRGHNLLDPKGKVWREAWEARERGVLFDCAHGMSHFNFSVAKKAIEQGFYPDLVSSDMTSLGLTRSDFCELPIVMSQLMALGMSFEDILLCCSKKPAELMKGIVTGIKVGNPANLTVLRIEDRHVEFTDSEGQHMKGKKLIMPEMTIIKGEVVYRR